MEKIKSLLHPHGSHKDRETSGDVTHDQKGTTGTAAQSATATSGHQSTPIYDQMTGNETTSSTTGEPPKFSNTPNVGAGTGTGTGTSTGLGEGKHAGHVGTDGPIGGARVAGASGNDAHPDYTSRTGDVSHHNDSSRPEVSSGAYNGNSEASIKSGVIGFTPGSGGQGHAALPSNIPFEDRLDRNQIVGQGNTGSNTDSGLKNETINEQPSTLPLSSSTGHQSTSVQQPYDSSRTADTDRSFPLAGGVTSRPHESSPATHALGTNERELGTKERQLAGHDHDGRGGLAGAAAAATGTAAAIHSHSSGTHDSTFGNRSPTGLSHMTSSVPEHNIHPDALHAAGAPALNTSNTPGHGPPYETPHVNTGTLLDYETAFGSDPHTKHTGLLSYRPHVHRSGTSPHVPGEFPGATPENERSEHSFGIAGVTAGAPTGTTSTGPSTQHDLRHTGSLDDPSSRSTDTSSGHHLGRNAAIAGGVGAAGLGAHAAHPRHETPSSGSGNLYDDKNPYSSTKLDPRVVGGESRLNEQRFDPQASSTPRSSQPLAGSTGPVSPPRAGEQQTHHGRDAAVGAGALGAGALAGSALSSDRHHNEPGMQQTSTLPPTQHTSGTADRSTFGTTGAPAPRFENTTSTSHQSPSISSAPYSESQPQHHYGRDAGLAGAGAATAGGLAYAGHHDQPRGQHTVGSTAEDPASKTIGPHSSNVANILDPRVRPDPEKQKDHTTTGPHQSDTLNRLDPKVDDKAGQHHYGRDAAVAGGAGAAGYGAYEAAQAYGDHRSTQPAASMTEQRYDPTAPGARASNPVPRTSEYNYNNPDVAALGTGTGVAGATAAGHHHGHTQQPITTAQQAQAYKSPEITDNDLGPRDNSSRNAALGAGAGLAGATAVGYGLSHHGDNTHQTSVSQTPGSSTQPGSSTLPQPTGSLTQSKDYPYNTDPTHAHDKRDAAVLGGAGAAAGAGAGYAYGQRQQPQFDPKEQERLEKETAKRQHELEKQHDKEVHKLEKKHEKDLKKHDKEAAHHEEPEKKGGLLGFLHRDKSKRDKSSSPESTPRQSEEHHYGRDAAVAGGVGAGAAGLAAHEDSDEHGHSYKAKNLLHKDPPPGHPAREALESGHANQRIGVDGPIGTSSTRPHEELTGRTDEHHYGRDAAIGGGALGAGGLAAHELSNKDSTSTTVDHPTTGLAGSQQATIPGNTTSGSVLGDRTHDTPAHNTFTSGKREHIGVDGPIGDPNMISGDRQTQKGVYGAHPVSDLAQDRTVIEPRTGLPMNVGRYGDGAGGTDGNTTIGHHHHETVPGQVQPGTAETQHATTNWEDISKKNTIY